MPYNVVVERCVWGNYECLLPAKVLFMKLARSREAAAASIKNWEEADAAKKEVDAYLSECVRIGEEKVSVYCRKCNLVLAPGG